MDSPECMGALYYRKEKCVVKLVNLLPVAISVNLDLGKMAAGAKAHKSVIQGLPTDKVLSVKTIATSVGKVLEDTLPPYSFIVWKIH